MLLELMLAAALQGAAELTWICRDDAHVEVAADPRTDAELGAAVRRSVLANRSYSMFDAVGFHVKDGVVTLGGLVLDARRRSEIAARVASLPGVRQVHNGIVVAPDSAADDKLRRRVAKAVYGAPTFAKRAREAHPLHVIVDGGKVTLRGPVADAAERSRIVESARAAADGAEVVDGLEIQK
jgi:osmotically-inducible protein OsmY